MFLLPHADCRHTAIFSFQGKAKNLMFVHNIIRCATFTRFHNLFQENINLMISVEIIENKTRPTRAVKVVEKISWKSFNLKGLECKPCRRLINYGSSLFYLFWSDPLLQYIFIYEFMHANDEQKVGIFLANIIASAAFFVVASRVGFICINLEITWNCICNFEISTTL